MSDRSDATEGGDRNRQKNPFDHFLGNLIRDASSILPSIKERLDPSHRNQTNSKSSVAEANQKHEEGDKGNVNDEDNQRGVKEMQDLLSSSMKLPPTPLSNYTGQTDETNFYSATSILSPSSDTHGGEISQPSYVDVVSPISFEGSSTVSNSEIVKDNVMEGTMTTAAVPQHVEPSTSTDDSDNLGEISFGGEWSTAEVNQVLSKQLNQVRTLLDELRTSHQILLRHHREECQAKKRLQTRVNEQERTITSLKETNRRLEMQVEGQDGAIMNMRKEAHERADKVTELQVKVNQSDAKVKELQQQIYFLTIERENWWANSTLPTGPPSLFQPCSPWNPTGHVDGNFMPYSYSPPRAPSNSMLPTSSFFPSPSSAFVPSGTNYPFGSMTPSKPTWLSTPPGFSSLPVRSSVKSNIQVSTEKTLASALIL